MATVKIFLFIIGLVGGAVLYCDLLAFLHAGSKWFETNLNMNVKKGNADDDC